MARNLSHPVRFEPSVRVGGQVCLNAARVIPGATYEVEVDDLRTEVLMNLTDEEMMDIKTTFEVRVVIFLSFLFAFEIGLVIFFMFYFMSIRTKTNSTIHFPNPLLYPYLPWPI